MKISGYNGGDEEEIMDKVINAYSDYARDSTNNKTSQKVLSKKAARRTAEVVLEATHKLKKDKVPDYIKNNFEAAWSYFDQNNEGWIRYEETHQFLRHLAGRLNKFNIAPGSIIDLNSGGASY